MITKASIRLIKSLRKKKHRNTKGLFIVEGVKVVDELIESQFTIFKIFATSEWILSHDIDSVELIEISESDLLKISNLKTPNQVLAVVHITNSRISTSEIKKSGNCLVLDKINDPGNLGTIIRICNWFSVKHLICSEDTVDVFNPKVVQSSMGSIFHVKVEYRNLLKFFNEVHNKIPIYISCVDGNDIKTVNYKSNSIILLGNESHGVSSNLLSFATNKVGIKSFSSKVDSLNVAVAAGILLYSFCES